MKFSETFNVEYYNDEHGQALIAIKQHGPQHEETVFKHMDTELLTDQPVDTQHTRTQFTDTSGGRLEKPWVYALTAQMAIGEAMKVMVDRAAAQLDPYPFEKES